MSTNYIGLNADKSKELSDLLNKLLSNLEIHYQNLRGLHWNITGTDFFELHVKYEEQYTRIQVVIDEVAERILTLGQRPLHTFSSFLENTDIQEMKDVSKGIEGVKYVVDAHKTLLEIERKALDLSGETGDEGTNALMSDLIAEQEKISWMFQSYIS